jgi:hypothetical protein
VTAPSPDRRRPDGRYDEPSLIGQRVLAVLLGVLFLGLVAAVVLTLFARYGGDAVRGRVLGYDVQSDRRVSIEVEVVKNTASKAYCVIRARDARGAEVGRDVAVVDPVGSTDKTVRGTFALATTARAVTGEVDACTAEPLTREDVAP